MGGEAERNPQADSLLSVEHNVGLHPTTQEIRPEPKPRVGHHRLHLPDAPHILLYWTHPSCVDVK